MKKINLFFSAMCLALFLPAQTIADFENLVLSADSFWNGSDLTGGFSSGNTYYHNDYNTAFDAWSGFSYSNMKDSITSGFANQYSAITASGANGSTNYVVGVEYGNAKVMLTGSAAGGLVEGFYVTNSTYAYRSMKDGDMFAKKFGGSTGDDKDWLKLTLRGWLNGSMKPNEVEFYLADYRFADNSEDYIVDSWQWLNLLPLGNVDSIQFFMSSSDTGTFGMNTPAYFCIDDFTTADEINEPPVANDDLIIIKYLQDTIIDVLANDIDRTALPLSVQLISQPMITGAYSNDTMGTFIYYQPAVSVVAMDTLYYQVCDFAGECDTAMLLVDVTSLLSIGNMMKNEASAFPNPFTNHFIVNHSHDVNRLLLYDLNGSEVFRFFPEAGSLQSVVMPGVLPNGIYILKLTSNSGVQTTRLIKQ